MRQNLFLVVVHVIASLHDVSEGLGSSDASLSLTMTCSKEQWQGEEVSLRSLKKEFGAMQGCHEGRDAEPVPVFQHTGCLAPAGGKTTLQFSIYISSSDLTMVVCLHVGNKLCSQIVRG